MATKLISIAGVEIQNPDSYQPEVYDLHDTGSNVCGQQIGSPIRNNIEKISLTWDYLTVEQWADILNKFPVGTIEYSVSFYSTLSAGWVTKQMTVSNRTAGLYFKDPITKLPKYWKSCSLTFTEV